MIIELLTLSLLGLAVCGYGAMLISVQRTAIEAEKQAWEAEERLYKKSDWLLEQIDDVEQRKDVEIEELWVHLDRIYSRLKALEESDNDH